MHKKLFIAFFMIIALTGAGIKFLSGDLFYPINRVEDFRCNLTQLQQPFFYQYYDFDEIIINFISFPTIDTDVITNYPSILKKKNLENALVQQLEKSFKGCLTTSTGNIKPITVIYYQSNKEMSIETINKQTEWLNDPDKLVLQVRIDYYKTSHSENAADNGFGRLSYVLYRPGVPVSYPPLYEQKELVFFSGELVLESTQTKGVIKNKTSKKIEDFISKIEPNMLPDPKRCPPGRCLFTVAAP